MKWVGIKVGWMDGRNGVGVEKERKKKGVWGKWKGEVEGGNLKVLVWKVKIEGKGGKV